MTDNSANQLAQVIAAVQLENVRLVEASAVAEINAPNQIEGPVNIGVNASAEPAGRSEAGFLVRASFEAGVEDTSKGQTPVRVRVVWELAYSLSGVEPTDQVLERFAQLNGLYNAWPYGREFIQQMTARMQLPNIVLPVFRVASLKPSRRVPPRATGQVAPKKRARPTRRTAV